MVLTLNKSFLLCLLQLLYLYVFSHFPCFLQKLHCSLVKEIFSKSFFAVFLTSVFLLMYSFNLTFSLKLMTLCNFCKSNPWLMLVLNFLWEDHTFFHHAIWLQIFQLNSIFILSGKKSKWLWKSWKSLGYWTSASRKYTSSLSSL